MQIIKINELEEFEKKLNFGAIKNTFCERLNSIKEKLRLRKITRKTVRDIEKLETEIKDIEKLKIDTIGYKISKLVGDLDMEKRFEIGRMRKIEIKLEKLKMPKTIVDAITKSVISKKYLYHILRHKKYFDY